MSEAAISIHPLEREAYLELEAQTDTRHELIEGVAYAMSGGTIQHGIVAGNLFAMLHNARRDPCRVFQHDTKLRIATDISETFFYPDVMLCCDPADNHHLWRERPVFLAEVLSPSTEKTDFGAKLLLYRSIPGLLEYALIGASMAEVTLYRRSAGWKPLHVDLDVGVTLESADVTLNFDNLYDGVTF